MNKIYTCSSSLLKTQPVPIFYLDTFMNRLFRKYFLGNWIKYLSITSFIILTGCSTYSETFDCPPGSGVGCKSIREVDHMIDEGKLLNEKPTSDLPIDFASYKLVAGKELRSHPALMTSVFPPLPLQGDDAVLRLPEHPLRIWIAAFQDEKGNLFSDSFVYTIFKPGEWRINRQSES